MSCRFRVSARFNSGEELLEAYRSEITRGGLLVRGAVLKGAVPMDACDLEIHVEGQRSFRMEARVATVLPGVGVAVLIPEIPIDLENFIGELQSASRGLDASAVGDPASTREGSPGREAEAAAPVEKPAGGGTLRDRIKAMSTTEKMKFALRAERDARFLLLQDVNPALHAYVLRNPRIGLDEVQQAVRLNTLSPEAFKIILAHHEWGKNPTVCAGISRNPKAPLPIALKAMDFIPINDLRAIAKGAGRMPLVREARKRMNRR